jgi:hypothetical protein
VTGELQLALGRWRRRVSLLEPLRSVVVDPDGRAAAAAVALVLAAGAVCLVAPVVPLLVVPLVLGVPHLASEVRWLAVRRRLPRFFLGASIPVGLVLAGLGLWTWAHPENAVLSARLEVTLAAIWMVVGAACGSGRRRTLVVTAVSGIGALFLLVEPAAPMARDAAVGTHAFATVALWMCLYRRKRLYAVPALLLLTAGLGAVTFLRGPLVGQAFLLSVHYSVWLLLVPLDGAARSGPTPLETRARQWSRDLGAAGLVAAVAGVGAVWLVTCVLGPQTARDAYIATVRFHVWSELALGALLLSGGRLPLR